VTVNSVAPGPTRTRAMELLPPNIVAEQNAEIPMGSVCEPEDIANAVLFFSSSMSRLVTGQTLMVNGGRCMI
jgi:3-oxoacyl-[acyl-carrier protein] reductase